jgi:futalosine hydrolase
MIALLCSVQAEADTLVKGLLDGKAAEIGSKTLLEGTLGGRRVVLCAGGMGKVNAAHAATLAITRHAPAALIVFGIGGAYPASGARIGDVAIARYEIAGDEGVLTHDGFKDTEYIGIPLLKTASSGIFTTYPAAEPLVDLARSVLRAQPPAGEVHTGPFVTLSTCTGTLDRARELEQRYGGLCENMEGAAAAHVAIAHGVPWLEVRGISNIVEDRDLVKWDIPRAARTVQQAVIRILEAWDR